MTGTPLRGTAVRHGVGRPSVEHAAWLLGLLGAGSSPEPGLDGLRWEDSPTVGAGAARDPATDWAASGAMALTGATVGPPLVAPGMPASAARAAALGIEALTAAVPSLRTVALDGGRLLGERAALAGLRRRGAVSPGGSCRLVAAADGLLAVNLPRSSDVGLLGAWLQVEVAGDPWATVTGACAGRGATDLVERAQLLGLPVAAVAPPSGLDDDQSQARGQPARVEPWRVDHEHRGAVRDAPGRVVDLSSMWAGPLCAHILGLAGFEVVKVESRRRPDGARSGPAAFYDLLHAGHRSVSLDFDDPAERARLAALMEGADVVVESSRPRALDQLGLGPEVVLARSPATVWVSVTGYGRRGPWCNRVAFGDDAAVAGGLVATAAAGPVFCGDAIADPLTGLHAALVASAMWSAGMGGLADVALREVAASCVGRVGRGGGDGPTAVAGGGPQGWVLDTGDGRVPVAEPVARAGRGPAAASGADDELLRDIPVP